VNGLASLSLVFNALVWGLSWWPLRQLQLAGLHPLWATMLFFAAGAVLLVLWRPSVVGQVLRQPALLALGCVAGLTNASFNWGVSIGDVVRVVLLFYLMPLWAALLAWVLLRESLTWQAGLRMGLALCGAMLVLKPEGQGWPTLHSVAEVLGLLGGFGFALTNVLLRQQASQPVAMRAFAMFSGCTLLPGALALGLSQSGVVAAWPAWSWSWGGLVLAMSAVFVVANLALQYGAGHLPVRLTSVLMLTEVIFASGSSVLWGGAALTGNVMAGGALIVLAALLAAVGERDAA